MTGIDGYDWSIFGGNPVPGDPDAVRAIGGHLLDLSDEVRQQNSLLRSVGSDTSSVWSGGAANAFHPQIQKLPGQLDQLTTSYADASEALGAYWPRLRQAQTLAVQALSRAQVAQQDITAAQSQVSSARTQAGAAGSSYNTASSAASTATTPPTATQTAKLASLQSSYQAAQGHVGSAQSALSSARGQMTSAQAMKQQAVDDAHAAAVGVAAALHTAGENGIHNVHHSFWSSVVGGVEGTISGWVKDGERDVHDAEQWVDKNAFALSLVLGPVGLLLTSKGRDLIEQGLKDAAPTLKILSGALGVASLVLSVAAFIPIVGELAEVANEGVMGLKTVDDGLLALSGDKEAEKALALDGLMMATGGLGRVFQQSGDLAEAGEKVEGATEALSTAGAAQRGAEDGVSDAGDALRSVKQTERAESMAADDYAGLARFADGTGGDAAPLERLQSDAEQNAADARAGVKEAEGDLSGAQATLDDANGTVAQRTQALQDATSGRDVVAGESRTQAFTGAGPARTLVGDIGGSEGATGTERLVNYVGRSSDTTADGWKGFYGSQLSGAGRLQFGGVLVTKAIDFGVESTDLNGNVANIGDGAVGVVEQGGAALDELRAGLSHLPTPVMAMAGGGG